VEVPGLSAGRQGYGSDDACDLHPRLAVEDVAWARCDEQVESWLIVF
jgi:hypothetical protein